MPPDARKTGSSAAEPYFRAGQHHTFVNRPDEGTIMLIIQEIQRRSAHIHWPQGIVPEQADLFAHNDIVIAAPPGKIWEHLIHATASADWSSNASDVSVNA